MSNPEEKGWEIGERVAYYKAYSRVPSCIATIETVHKNGRAIVFGTMFQSARNGYASATGDGYSRPSIRRLTPELEELANKAAKERRIHDIGRWLETSGADDVPDDLLRSLLDLQKAAKARAALKPAKGETT